jgi:hypothetical protein
VKKKHDGHENDVCVSISEGNIVRIVGSILKFWGEEAVACDIGFYLYGQNEGMENDNPPPPSVPTSHCQRRCAVTRVVTARDATSGNMIVLSETN